MTSPGTPRAERPPAAGWLELLLWSVGRRRRYRVSGRSLLPLLQDGDEVLAKPRATCREGDLVVASHPFRRDVVLVKRLAGWDEDGRARLLGDNPAESTDSRGLGTFRPESLLARVTSRLAGTERTPG